MSRVLVVGLDSFSPDLVELWRPELPNLHALMERGIYGPLESIVQPVTPAAWTAMISGRNPGHFGFTDFLYREGPGYDDYKLVHSRRIRVPTLATLLPAAGRRVMMVGVPISYPPIPIPGGVCVSCFMAPSLKRGITHPPELQDELLAQTSSPYLLDASLGEAADDPEIDRDELLGRIRELDRQRFDVARHLMTSRPWDLLFMVAMGPDRVSHYFKRFQDPAHGRHDPDPRYRDAIREQYRYCDQRLGELVELAGPDTVVMVVSDHGIQRLDGKLNLNDWLAAHGFLHLGEPVTTPTPLGKAPVDWGRTRAWARGYGGQVHLNLRGRDPQGTVEPGQVENVLGELEERLSELATADGRRLQVTTLRKEQIFDGPHAGRCPDLCLQIEELRYLTSDRVGNPGLITPVSELGIDDASHAMNGFCALAGPGVPALGPFAALQILDVAPTLFDLLEVAPPPGLEGRPIQREEEVYSSHDESELTSRLQALYLE